MTASAIPALALVPSLAAFVLILLSGERPRLRAFWTFAAALTKFALIASMLPGVLRGETYAWTLVELAPGVGLTLKADALGLLFALLSSFLWIVTSSYAVGYMKAAHEKNLPRFFASFALCLCAAVGVAFSANLLTFFLFYELLTVSTYPLVAHKETPEAVAGGRKYLAYTLGAGAVLLLAVAWTYSLTGGNLDFTPGGFLAGAGSSGTLRLLFLLFVIAFAVKAGLMPLHAWLPAAMVAPTPVSALLHAVAVVKAGVFAILRLTGYVYGPELMHGLGLSLPLAGLASFTILAASLIAMRQDNLKKRLAFSTVSQLSYIVLGAALATPLSFLGALLHMINHGFMKITLFFCAGSIYATHHRTEIPELGGIGRRMPLTLGAFTLAAAAMAGTPFLAGFVSKWHLGLGALQARRPEFVAVLVLSGVLNLAYFMPISRAAFFDRDPEGEAEKTEDSPWSMLAPILTTAAIAAVLGFALPAIGAQTDLAGVAVRAVWRLP